MTVPTAAVLSGLLIARPGRSMRGLLLRGAQGRAWILTLSALLSCVPADAPLPTVTMRDSAGVTVVDNLASGREGCVVTGPRRALIAAEDAADPGRPPLFRIRGGTVLGDGRIVVLNGGSRELLYFDQSGQLVGRAGGAGGGPGEFAAPLWVGRAGRDTILVWDDEMGRLSYFAGATFVSSIQVPAVSLALQSVFRRFADGTYVTAPAGLSHFPSTDRMRLPLAFHRYEPEGERLTLLAEGLDVETGVANGARYDVPFGPSSAWAARSADFVLADTGIPELRYYSPAGSLIRLVRWPAVAAVVSASDRDRYRAHWDSLNARFPLPRDAEFAERRPFVEPLTVDRADRVWVQEYGMPWEAPAQWLVFDAQGALQCTASLPDIRVLEIDADYVLGVARGPDGEESVVLHGLEVRER